MPRSADVISHWHHSVENLSASSLEFYASLEESLHAKQILDLFIERVDWNEGGILSAKRTYLRVGYKRFVFDICAAPFGKDFFFSWWLGKTVPSLAGAVGCVAIVLMPVVLLMFVVKLGLVNGVVVFFILAAVGIFASRQIAVQGESGIEDILLTIPLLGILYKRLFKPSTYYSEDTRVMFEETIHRVVVEHVATVLSVAKLPPLTPEDLKPQTRKWIFF